MLLGNIGVPGGGVNPLRGQSNVQGACDMGGLPNVFTAYQPVTSPEARQKFQTAWNVPVLAEKPGLTIVESLNAAIDGRVQALYVMGENPVISDPDQHHVIEALGKLDFLVVQDISLTETAQYASVVLPSCAFLEKEGTVSDTERRVQLMHRVLEPIGDIRDDWWIITEIANRMGADWKYDKAEDIFDEMRQVTPSYAGLTYERVDKELMQWPCPTPGHPGTQFLHKDRFTRGLGLLSAIDYTPPAEEVDPEYPLILTTGRVLEHFHTGTSVVIRRSSIRSFRNHLEIGRNAQNYHIVDDEMISVSTRRGSIRMKARISSLPKPNVIFIPFHFHEACANVLTIDALDPVCKIPEFKVCACKIEKVYPMGDNR